MSARPVLRKVAKLLAAQELDAVVVGDAAAALRGAPVTALHVEFLFRNTPANLKKLKGVANGLRAVILKPYYPVFDFFRVVNDDLGVRLDFMTRLPGIKSYEGLRSRSAQVKVGRYSLTVASLADVIKIKREAGRHRDLPALPILEDTLREQKKEHRKQGPKGGN